MHPRCGRTVYAVTIYGRRRRRLLRGQRRRGVAQAARSPSLRRLPVLGARAQSAPCGSGARLVALEGVHRRGVAPRAPRARPRIRGTPAAVIARELCEGAEASSRHRTPRAAVESGRTAARTLALGRDVGFFFSRLCLTSETDVFDRTSALTRAAMSAPDTEALPPRRRDLRKSRHAERNPRVGGLGSRASRRTRRPRRSSRLRRRGRVANRPVAPGGEGLRARRRDAHRVQLRERLARRRLGQAVRATGSERGRARGATNRACAATVRGARRRRVREARERANRLLTTPRYIHARYTSPTLSSSRAPARRHPSAARPASASSSLHGSSGPSRTSSGTRVFWRRRRVHRLAPLRETWLAAVRQEPVVVRELRVPHPMRVAVSDARAPVRRLRRRRARRHLRAAGGARRAGAPGPRSAPAPRTAETARLSTAAR